MLVDLVRCETCNTECRELLNNFMTFELNQLFSRDPPRLVRDLLPVLRELRPLLTEGAFLTLYGRVEHFLIYASILNPSPSLFC